jgi:hypothetical protein
MGKELQARKGARNFPQSAQWASGEIERVGGDCGGGITKLTGSNKGSDAAASEATQ